MGTTQSSCLIFQKKTWAECRGFIQRQRMAGIIGPEPATYHHLLLCSVPNKKEVKRSILRKKVSSNWIEFLSWHRCLYVFIFISKFFSMVLDGNFISIKICSSSISSAFIGIWSVYIASMFWKKKQMTKFDPQHDYKRNRGANNK